MSFEAVLWATSDAPIADVNEFAVLVMMAEKADPDGCTSFPSRPTLAKRTKVDSRTVLRSLQRMEERKLIGLGDQRAAEYIRADRRPVVYDLLIPADWFPNLERINTERADKGKPPLNRQNRPPIAPPPEKKQRSDKGKARPSAKLARTATKRASSRGVSQAPRESEYPKGHGVSLSPARGVSESGAGCLEDTQTSPMNQSFEPARHALSARSAVDGAAFKAEVVEAEGGVAASSTTSPPDLPHQTTCDSVVGGKDGSKKAEHTRQQLELVAAVRSQFPAAFLAVLPDVPTLTQAILDALAGDVPAADRTVAQLGARIEQRWNHHGWATKFYAGEIEKPVGAAHAMVRPLRRGDRYGCANPRCDAGFNVDLGTECPTCVERAEVRQAERRQEKAQGAAEVSNAEAMTLDPVAMPTQRNTAPVRALSECANPTCRAAISTANGDELCGDCRAEADDAEETVRLRAQLAAHFGTPEQVAAYGPPPF